MQLELDEIIQQIVPAIFRKSKTIYISGKIEMKKVSWFDRHLVK